MLLGSDKFVSSLQPLLEGKHKLKEFPRAQRLIARPALKTLFPAHVKGDTT